MRKLVLMLCLLLAFFVAGCSSQELITGDVVFDEKLCVEQCTEKCGSDNGCLSSCLLDDCQFTQKDAGLLAITSNSIKDVSN